MPLNPEAYRLPLHELFEALRTHDFSLGVDDYLLLIEAMSKGFGLAHLEDLYQLCEHLWLKPNQSRSMFRDLFDRFVQEEQIQAQAASQRITSPEPAPLPELQDGPEWNPLDLPVDAPATESIPTFSSASQEIKLSVTSTLEQALGLAINWEEEQASILSEQTFVFQGSYQPISSRNLEIGWRNLLRTTHTRKRHEIDLARTLEHLMKTGRLNQLFYQEEKVKHAGLLLLMDWGGSMLAFHPFLRQLAEANPGEYKGLTRELFFHDVPGPQLFTEPEQLTAYPIAKLLHHGKQHALSVLIISDAGAARGNYDRQRVIQTAQALNALKGGCRHIAWLNPVPQSRWEGSSAQYIRQLVPMFEADVTGWQHSLEVLQGKQLHLK